MILRSREHRGAGGRPRAPAPAVPGLGSRRPRAPGFPGGPGPAAPAPVRQLPRRTGPAHAGPADVRQLRLRAYCLARAADARIQWIVCPEVLPSSAAPWTKPRRAGSGTKCGCRCLRRAGRRAMASRRQAGCALPVSPAEGVVVPAARVARHFAAAALVGSIATPGPARRTSDPGPSPAPRGSRPARAARRGPSRRRPPGRPVPAGPRPGREPDHRGQRRATLNHVDAVVVVPLPSCPRRGGRVAHPAARRQYHEGLPPARSGVPGL